MTFGLRNRVTGTVKMYKTMSTSEAARLDLELSRYGSLCRWTAEAASQS